MPKILNKHYPTIRIIFIMGETGCILCSLLLAMGVTGQVPSHELSTSVELWGKLLLVTAVFQIALYYNDLYSIALTEGYLDLGVRLVQSIGISSIALAIIYYIAPSVMIGRGVFLVSTLFLIMLITSWRFLYSWSLKKQMFRQKVIVIGNGRLGQSIIREINSRTESGYHVAGIATNLDNGSSSPDGHMLMSDLRKLEARAEDFLPYSLVVALDDRRGKLPVEELLRCKMAGMQVIDGVTFYETLTGKILIEAVRPSWLIFCGGFNANRAMRILKRCTDLLMSLSGLLLTFPLTFLTAVTIKLTSAGPIFYTQVRCGEEGRKFTLYKFRSMVDGAEGDSGAVWADVDDSRITKVGRIIRKFRIDETPQMWNVLKGNMSFVGPRPERPEFVDQLRNKIPYYEERMNVKPGITGWAQVCFPYGSTVEDAMEKLRYELFYIKNMNLLFDLVIIFQSFKIILLGRGAR